MLRETFVSGTDTAFLWYASGLRFACKQCGGCCSGAPGYVWVDSEEIERIARFLGMTDKEFHKRHVRRVGRGRSLLERPGGDCEFLERPEPGTTRCRIHTVRPVQCRTWPFWESNVDTPEDWEAAGRGCPGIDQGDVHPLPVIQTALKENGRRPL